MFGDLLKLGKYLELRSNWKIYLEEFALAVFLHTGRNCEVNRFVPQTPITPFERKYLASGQELYHLIFQHNDSTCAPFIQFKTSSASS